ncbi:hypothetical protein [Azonexus sp.]|uniref:hypothetical protein n=1 Tax=Azonexus sp. TaxID=1872668 RepID=UPI0035AFB798
MNKNNDRRVVNDRRQDDIGPPSGWRDRRRRAERRLPELREFVMSEADFQTYFAPRKRSGTTSVAGPLAVEEAFDTFTRIRD